MHSSRLPLKVLFFFIDESYFFQEGKRKVERLTLFFMLHCGKPLYNSVLWANWGPRLSNVIILGNRFSSYQER